MPAMWEDFVSEIGVAPGTGAVTLTGPNPDIPCMTFLTAGYATGDWVYYVITDGAAGGQSEQCMGQFNATAGTLSRATTIKTNTGGTSPLNFTTTVKVFAFSPASKVAYFNQNNNLLAPGNVVIPNSKAYYATDTGGASHPVLWIDLSNFVDVQAASTQGIRFLSLAGAGLLGCDNSGNLNTAGLIQSATGYLVKAGSSGGTGGNLFNIWYSGVSGGPHLYIDNTDFGVISFVSDRRIKHMIANNVAGALSRVMSLRPVTYRFANIGLFTDDGAPKLGLIADEVEQVIPSAVNGEADAMQFDGTTPQPQSLNAMAIVAELISAVQELKAIVDTQAARIAALENA